MSDTDRSVTFGRVFGAGALLVAGVGFLLGIGAAASSAVAAVLVWLASALLAGAGVLALPSGRRRIGAHTAADLSGRTAAAAVAGVTMVSVVIFFAGVGVAPAPAGDETTPGASATPTATATPTPTPTPTATPTEEQRIRQAIREADYDVTAADIDTIRAVEVTESANGHTVVSVRARADSYSGAVDAARTGAANAYVVARAVYTDVDGVDVDEVYVFTLADFTDQYGNTEEGTAVKVVVERETADRIDWDGLRELVNLDYKNMLVAADSYKIHLAICEELDEVYPDCAK